MIETIENAAQLIIVWLCFLISIFRTYKTESRAWGFLALFYFSFFLGDLYWLTYLVFYRDTPQYSYISGFSWYAAYLFLLLLLRHLLDRKASRQKQLPLWFILVFTGGMGLFYMQWGDYPGNLITAVLMSFLLWRAVQGLIYPEDRDPAKRRIYIAVLVFCLVEYAMWTISCFFDGDTLADPYYWFDAAFTVSIATFLPLLGKVVDA